MTEITNKPVKSYAVQNDGSHDKYIEMHRLLQKTNSDSSIGHRNDGFYTVVLKTPDAEYPIGESDWLVSNEIGVSSVLSHGKFISLYDIASEGK